MSFFVIKSAKQNSYRMDIFIATKIKSTYNKNIFSEFYKRIRSGWEISESDEKMWGVNMSRTDEEIKRYETLYDNDRFTGSDVFLAELCTKS